MEILESVLTQLLAYVGNPSIGGAAAIIGFSSAVVRYAVTQITKRITDFENRIANLEQFRRDWELEEAREEGIEQGRRTATAYPPPAS